MIFGVLIGMGLLSSFFKNSGTTERNSFILQIFIVVYVLMLLLVLNAVGGESTLGISLNEPFLWVAVFITIVQLGFQWKRVIEEKWQQDGRGST